MLTLAKFFYKELNGKVAANCAFRRQFSGEQSASRRIISCQEIWPKDQHVERK